ncbi:MAG: class I SAM-dependent methyltransferase, partial [Propionibacteriaceae bacterium]
ADESVGLVISSLSLHHWPDPEAGIGEIQRVLRPGGRVWLYDVNPQLATTLSQLQAQGVQARIEPLARRTQEHGRVREHILRAWISRLEID